MSAYAWEPGRSSPALNSTNAGELELDPGPGHTATSQPRGKGEEEGQGGLQVT